MKRISTPDDPPKLTYAEAKLLQTARKLTPHEQDLLTAIAEAWVEIAPKKPALRLVTGGSS